MPTAHARIPRLFAGRHSRRAQRGQVMPIFALLVGLVILFASLLIDGAFAFQNYRDLDSIAYHAARAGANDIVANCAVAPGSSCPLAGSAITTAKKWATDWAAQDKLVLVLNNATISGSTITVHLRICYALVLPLAPISSGSCPAGSWQIDSTQEARSLVGP